jgi:hypothetical protein
VREGRRRRGFHAKGCDRLATVESESRGSAAVKLVEVEALFRNFDELLSDPIVQALLRPTGLLNRCAGRDHAKREERRSCPRTPRHERADAVQAISKYLVKTRLNWLIHSVLSRARRSRHQSRSAPLRSHAREVSVQPQQARRFGQPISVLVRIRTGTVVSLNRVSVGRHCEI